MIPETTFTLGVAGGPAALGSFLPLSRSPCCDSGEGLAHPWPFQGFGSHWGGKPVLQGGGLCTLVTESLA